VTEPLAKRLLAETAGTAILVGLGTGAIVATASVADGRFVLLAAAWFLAVTIPVALFASISGAHLNPVVTLALAADRRIPAAEAAPHFVAQFAGAFLGSAVVLGVFGSSHGLGATVPTGGDEFRAFVLEFVFTWLLVVSVLALVRYGVGRRRWRLTWPGAVVAASTYLIGPWTGSSLNPARTLAPAILSGTYAGLWLYIVAPPLGALAAVGLVRWWVGAAPESMPK
jgi:glycerol uptake facilitator-like aquaporin